MTQRSALEERVLPHAGTQTLSRPRAALARAILAIDPDGAAERHAQRRQDRRVVLNPDADGMATLWALLSAPDATAAYQHLCHLARDLGAADPRGMDARRADLLTGRRRAATATPSTATTAPTPPAPTAASTPPPNTPTPAGPTTTDPTPPPAINSRHPAPGTTAGHDPPEDDEPPF